MHPSHESQKIKLNRITGQIEAIKKMIDEKKYCVDILNQIKAARQALKAVELSILEKHMNNCLYESSNNKDAQEEKISELLKILKKYE